MREAGLDTPGLASRTKLDVEDIEACLTGALQPTSTQLKKIAETLKRPVALFYLETPPEATSVPRALRRAAGADARELKPEELLQARRANRLQRLMRWIMLARDQAGPKLPNIHGLLPSTAGEALRDWTGVTLAIQLGWETAKQAFDAWRLAVESRGLTVLQLQLGSEGLRGFSLLDEIAPLIAVNTGENYQARSFTLFHELAHLASGTESVCLNRIRPGSRASVDLERWCEEVASACLLPRQAVTAAVGANGEFEGDVERIHRLADLFKVSLRAAAVALIRLSLVDRNTYATIEQEAPLSDREKGFARGTGQRAPQRRQSELGNRALTLVFSALRDDLLTERDARDYLRLDGSEISDLSEQVLSGR